MGEIYISLETAQKQAEEYSASFKNEVFRLVAHGVYHLFGFNDDTAKKREIMTSLEDLALDSIF